LGLEVNPWDLESESYKLLYKLDFIIASNCLSLFIVSYVSCDI